VKTGSTFGKTAIVQNLAIKATLNPQVVVLKKTTVDNFFLGYMMGFQTIQRQISAAVVGGALPTLSQNLVAEFKIPVPPTRTEQHAIAKNLSDADALIESLEQLIAKQRHLKQGAMQELLTGKKRLPGFSGRWALKRLGELARHSSLKRDAGMNSPSLLILTVPPRGSVFYAASSISLRKKVKHVRLQG
jgi:type I restriction enzyme, S subunit